MSPYDSVPVLSTARPPARPPAPAPALAPVLAPARRAVAGRAPVGPPPTRRQSVGPHLLYRGDCVRVMERLIPPESVDVVVTSPPYNLGLAYRSYSDRRGEAEYLDWMLRVAAGVRRVLRPDGSFFLNITGSSAAPWLPFELIVRLRALFCLQNHITWVKSISIGDDTLGHFKPINSERFLHRNHEHIFHLTRSGTVPIRRLAVGVPFKDKSNIARRGHATDLRCRGDSWFIPYDTVRSRSEKHEHPGTFPLMLPRMCLRLHGRPGATLLDPFMGTGTSLVAAQAEGARGIGIEIDPAYVATARSRLVQAMKAARSI